MTAPWSITGAAMKAWGAPSAGGYSTKSSRQVIDGSGSWPQRAAAAARLDVRYGPALSDVPKSASFSTP
jgi:hypothetical protein